MVSNRQSQKFVNTSRVSQVLNNVIDLEFNPDMVNLELMELLNKKSKHFSLNGHTHDFNYQDPIFFRNGPINPDQY